MGFPSGAAPSLQAPPLLTPAGLTGLLVPPSFPLGGCSPPQLSLWALDGQVAETTLEGADGWGGSGWPGACLAHPDWPTGAPGGFGRGQEWPLLDSAGCPRRARSALAGPGGRFPRGSGPSPGGKQEDRGPEAPRAAHGAWALDKHWKARGQPGAGLAVKRPLAVSTGEFTSRGTPLSEGEALRSCSFRAAGWV